MTQFHTAVPRQFDRRPNSGRTSLDPAEPGPTRTPGAVAPMPWPEWLALTTSLATVALLVFGWLDLSGLQPW